MRDILKNQAATEDNPKWENIIKRENDKMKKIYTKIINDFENWLRMYWNDERDNICKNEVIFNMTNETNYYQAIIYYISGMTDNFAIGTYNEIVGF